MAALQWTPDAKKVEWKAIPASMLLTRAIAEEHTIGPGDELFFPGLLVTHHGKNRNLPIIRAGTIAAMREEPVLTKAYGEIDAYLVEARSIGGLSGSPVFVNVGPGRGGIVIHEGPSFFLLGLMHGHYDSELTDTDIALEDEPRAGQVNMGIAIVIPAEKIREALDQEEFAAQRAVTDEAERARLAAIPD